MTFLVMGQEVVVKTFDGHVIGKGWYIYRDDFQDIFIVDTEGNPLPTSQYILVPTGNELPMQIAEGKQ